MKESGSLYDTEDRKSATPTTGMWGGTVEVHASQTNSKNEYLKDLDKMDDREIEVEELIIYILFLFLRRMLLKKSLTS